MTKKRFFIFFISLIILFLVVSLYKRLTLYPTTSYNYDFDTSNAVIKKITNTNLQVSIPKDKDTIFLEVIVKPTLIGEILQPYVTIKSKDKELKNYFEIGAKGKRYITLSSFKNSKSIKLTPHFCKLGKTKKLISFKNTPLKDKKILILATHPDDAELSSFALYSKYHKNVFVLTLSGGDAGENNYDELYQDQILNSYLEKTKLRVINSFAVPFIGGVDINQSLNLCYFDFTFKQMYKNPNKTIKSLYTNMYETTFFRRYNASKLIHNLDTTKNNWNSLVKDIKYILTYFKPDIIITPHPKLDIHPDHRYSTVALFQAIKELKLNNLKLYMYAVHFKEGEHYPVGDTYSTMPLPPSTKALKFNSIYTYTLTKKEQIEKFLALESINDIRYDTQYLTLKGSAKSALKHIIKRIFWANDLSYFRRGVRSEELFFVIDSKDL